MAPLSSVVATRPDLASRAGVKAIVRSCSWDESKATTSVTRTSSCGSDVETGLQRQRRGSWQIGDAQPSEYVRTVFQVRPLQTTLIINNARPSYTVTTSVGGSVPTINRGVLKPVQSPPHTNCGRSADPEQKVPATKSHPAFQEATSHWKVVHAGGVRIRRERSTSSKTLGMKAVGSIVRGQAADNWLELLDEPGFMMMSSAEKAFLEQAPQQRARINSERSPRQLQQQMDRQKALAAQHRSVLSLGLKLPGGASPFPPMIRRTAAVTRVVRADHVSAPAEAGSNSAMQAILQGFREAMDKGSDTIWRDDDDIANRSGAAIGSSGTETTTRLTRSPSSPSSSYPDLDLVPGRQAYVPPLRSSHKATRKKSSTSLLANAACLTARAGTGMPSGSAPEKVQLAKEARDRRRSQSSDGLQPSSSQTNLSNLESRCKTAALRTQQLQMESRRSSLTSPESRTRRTAARKRSASPR